MIERLSKMVARWKYRRHQLGKSYASFYYFGQVGVALPVSEAFIYWPVDRPIALQVTQLSDFEAVGQRIQLTLQRPVALQKDVSDSTLHLDYEAEFLAGMEEFRACLGIGKRRFERELDVISIYHDPTGMLTLSKRVQAHGRFAFEGVARADYERTLDAGYANLEIGEAIFSLSDTP